MTNPVTPIRPEPKTPTEPLEKGEIIFAPQRLDTFAEYFIVAVLVVACFVLLSRILDFA